jgi:hypothetical protein
MTAAPAAPQPTLAVERGSAIASALVVAAGVLAFDWPAFTVVGLYWLENVVIGAFTVARMAAAGWLAGGASFGAMLFLMAFFSVHYGLFCFAHGVFVVGLLGGGFGAPMPGLPNPLVQIAARLMAEPLGWVAVAVVIVFVASDFLRWLAEARQRPPQGNELMFAPYRRIVVLHVALLGGAVLMAFFRLPQATVLVLVALKLAFDLREVRRPFTFAWKRTG